MAAPPTCHAQFASRGDAADELRSHNLSTVLTHLHVNGPASRSELTSLTGLNRSTIADLVDEMLAIGIVEEERAPPRSRADATLLGAAELALSHVLTDPSRVDQQT